MPRLIAAVRELRAQQTAAAAEIAALREALEKAKAALETVHDGYDEDGHWTVADPDKASEALVVVDAALSSASGVAAVERLQALERVASAVREFWSVTAPVRGESISGWKVHKALIVLAALDKPTTD